MSVSAWRGDSARGRGVQATAKSSGPWVRPAEAVPIPASEKVTDQRHVPRGATPSDGVEAFGQRRKAEVRRDSDLPGRINDDADLMIDDCDERSKHRECMRRA